MSLENEMKFHIREESETYSIYALSNKNRDKDLTHIDIDKCLDILNEVYEISKHEMMIFKIEYKYPDFRIPIIEYILFGDYGTKKLLLNHCKDLKAIYYIPKNISDYVEYKYDPLNEYYYDECIPSFYENSVDLTLKDRMNEFNRNNMSLCESICTFKGYINDHIICECDIKIKFNSFSNVNVSKYNLIHRFKNIEDKNYNFWIIKCVLFIFSKELITTNICSLIILGIILSFIIGEIIFYIKENKELYNKIESLIKLIYSNDEENKNNINNNNHKNKCKKDNNNVNNEHKIVINSIENDTNNNKISEFQVSKRKKIKGVIKSKNSQKSFQSLDMFIGNKRTNRANVGTLIQMLENKKKFALEKEINKYKEKTYNELNSLSYNVALAIDHRNFFKIYISLIMTRQLFAFAFNCKNDFNSKVMKICFLLYIFVIFLVVNTFLIDLSTLFEVFKSQGIIGIFYDPLFLVYITLIPHIIKNILVLIVFTEDDILIIRNNNNYAKRELIKDVLTIVTIKVKLFFALGIVTLIFFWVYIACFFSVFKKTTFFVLRNTLISFGVSMIIPILLGAIPAVLRTIALGNRKSEDRFIFYIISKIFQLFL